MEIPIFPHMLRFGLIWFGGDALNSNVSLHCSTHLQPWKNPFFLKTQLLSENIRFFNIKFDYPTNTG